MQVLELMRVHTNTIGLDATLRDAVDVMDLYQMVAVPVVDTEGRPVGIVTEADVEAALLVPFEAASTAMPAPVRDADTSTLSDFTGVVRVEKIMTAPPVCVDEHADVLEALSLILSQGLTRLPVTSDGRLIGMVSRIDICQAILEGQLGPES